VDKQYILHIVCVCACILAVVIQHAKCMCHIMLPSVTCLAVQYFSTFSHKWCNFSIKQLNIKCVLWFSLHILSTKFLILKRIQTYIIISAHRFLCTVPLFLAGFNETSIFLTDFQKIQTHIILHENPSSQSQVVPWGRILQTQQSLLEISQTCPKSHT
jgi:hypothetical protein